MGKPLNGPDWEDVTTYVSALEAVSKGTCIVSFVRCAGNEPAHLRVVATLFLPALASAGQPEALSRSMCFPSRVHRTMDGLVYDLIHTLDGEYHRRFTQDELPF